MGCNLISQIFLEFTNLMINRRTKDEIVYKNDSIKE